MFCKKCGTEIQDDAKFCPMCATPVETAEQEKEPDLQTKLAQEELEVLNKSKKHDSKIDTIMGFLFLVSIALIISKHYFVGIIAFIISLSVLGYSVSKDKKRDTLEHLSKGEKILNVCPKCKSANIEMSMVQTGNITTHGTSRVSNNINPLHPFTHTNVKKGADYNFATYGNQCHCRNCGFVFIKPEVHYVK